MFRVVISTLIILISAASSNAATILVSYPKGDEVALVTVEGEIVPNDEKEFQQKVSTVPKAVVAFQSSGGNVVAALRIGKLIRLRNFTTVVPDDMRCASACALAWLGGTNRLMGATARIGFHAAYDEDTGQETGAGNALVGAYLSQIGLPDVAVYYITKAAPTSMTWLNLVDAQKVGIDVSVLDAELTARGEPSTPGQSSAALQLHQRAREFIRAWYQTISGPDEDITPILNRIYSDTVRYFGKEMSRQDVITEQQRFLARWPVRHYIPKDGTVMINCDANALVCSATGVIQFDARSTARNRRSSGEAMFEYLLRFSSVYEKTPTIVSEDGKLLSRNFQALPDEPADPISRLFGRR